MRVAGPPGLADLTRRKFSLGLGASLLAAPPLLGRPAGATPASACAEFTNGYALPQTQSAQDLAAYLASEHFDYDLDGWFFFGNLVEGSSPRPDADDVGAFFIAIQRIEQSVFGFRVPLVPAIVGFNSASLGRYVFGGTATVDIDPLVVVSQDPWSVRVNSLSDPVPLMSMGLTSGTMGVRGASYRLTANLRDQLGGRLQADVLLVDRLGVVNEGYGTASFFPQFITDDQRVDIRDRFGGSVAGYLQATGNPMSCQGSYYYSLPMLEVRQFAVTRDGAPISRGTRGTMWMDYVVQSYDSTAIQVLGNASWLFFALQFPELNLGMMVIQLTSADGTLPVATLFGPASRPTRNGARRAVHSWGIDEIDLQPVPGTTWTSPATGEQYAMQYRLRLGSRVWPGDLTITTVRNDQEIVANNPLGGERKTIKYEGEAQVEGTLARRAVRGTGWLELQPIGHL